MVCLFAARTVSGLGVWIWELLGALTPVRAVNVETGGCGFAGSASSEVFQAAFALLTAVDD